MKTEELYVLQRCIQEFKNGRSNWETICRPVSFKEGLAQLDALHDHKQSHRLLTECPEAMRPGSITQDRMTFSNSKI